MGIFRDNAFKYHVLGLSVMPVKGKNEPQVSGSNTDLCKVEQTPEEVMELCGNDKFADCNIAVRSGGLSGIVWFDLDYDKHGAREFEEVVREILPPTVVERFGSKGFQAPYRVNGLMPTRKKTSKQVIDGKNHVITYWELLSDGRYTILPPSIHPDTNEPYRWTKGDLASDWESLPVITPLHLQMLEDATDKYFGLNGHAVSNSRNCMIWSYAYQTMKDHVSFESWKKDVVAYDKRKFGAASWFSDPKERGGKSVEQFVDKTLLSWQKSAMKLYRQHGVQFRGFQSDHSISEDYEGVDFTSTDGAPLIKNDDGSEKKREFEKFKDFYDRHWYFKNVRLDWLTGEPYRYENGRWVELLNELPTIKSLASDWHIYSKVEEHLMRCLKKEKRQILIDVPHWDGVSRIDKLLSYVTVKNVPQHVFVELMKDQSAGIFRRAFNPEEQNHMIVWESNQGKGKDMWFNNYFRGFGRYKCELSSGSKMNDMFGEAAASLVISLPEMDQFNISPGELKDFITSPGKRFRAPYARSAKFWPFRFSVYSTANLSSYMKDHTGNRRFWIFEIEDIDWDYPKYSGEESAQLVGEMFHLYKQGFRASADSVKMMSQVVESTKTPENLVELAMEAVDLMIEERLTNINIHNSTPDESGKPRKYIEPIIRTSHIASELKKIADNYGIRVKTLQIELNRSGRQKRDIAGRYFDFESIKRDNCIPFRQKTE